MKQSNILCFSCVHSVYFFWYYTFLIFASAAIIDVRDQYTIECIILQIWNRFIYMHNK